MESSTVERSHAERLQRVRDAVEEGRLLVWEIGLLVLLGISLGSLTFFFLKVSSYKGGFRCKVSQEL